MASSKKLSQHVLLFLFAALLTLSVCGNVSGRDVPPTLQPTARTAAASLWEELKDFIGITLSKLSFFELIHNSRTILEISKSVSSLSLLDYNLPENNCAVCEVSQPFVCDRIHT